MPSIPTTIKINEFQAICDEYFQESLNKNTNFSVSYELNVSRKFNHKVLYTSTIKTDGFRYYWFTDLGIYKTYNIDMIDTLSEDFVKHYTDLADENIVFTFQMLD